MLRFHRRPQSLHSKPNSVSPPQTTWQADFHASCQQTSLKSRGSQLLPAPHEGFLGARPASDTLPVTVLKSESSGWSTVSCEPKNNFTTWLARPALTSSQSRGGVPRRHGSATPADPPPCVCFTSPFPLRSTTAWPQTWLAATTSNTNAEWVLQTDSCPPAPHSPVEAPAPNVAAWGGGACAG